MYVCIYKYIYIYMYDIYIYKYIYTYVYDGYFLGHKCRNETQETPGKQRLRKWYLIGQTA